MSRFSRIALLALAGWGMPSIAAAQATTAQSAPRVTAPTEQDKMKVELIAAQGGGGRGGVMAPVETRITTGKPYSAEAMTESLQVLGDGNRITRKSVTRVYRDNEGRTRREQFDADGTARTITISDPVGQVSYTLNPQTKTGFQSTILAMKTPVVAAPSGYARGGGGGGGAAAASGGGSGTGEAGARGRGQFTQAEREEEMRKVERARVANVELAETSRPAAAQAKQVTELAASGGAQATRENLGEQVIEGVRATGARSTTVIPAGSIGNMNEIKIVSEQWFSPDLEILVLTKHSDPRVGETIYRLTNIVRAQPDPNLFVAPPDYTIKGRTVRYEQ